MRRPAQVCAVVIVLTLAALSAGGGGVGATTARSPQLPAFGSCPDLLAYVKQHALPLVGAYGLGGGRRSAALQSAPSCRGRRPSPARTASAASTTRRPTFRRVASTSPTSSSRTAPRSTSSAPTNSSPSTCARASRAWGLAAAPAGRSYELLLHGNRLLVARPRRRLSDRRSAAGSARRSGRRRPSRP